MAARFGSTRTARVASSVVCRHPRCHGPLTRMSAGPRTTSPRATGVTVYWRSAGRCTFHRARDGCRPGVTRSCTIAAAPLERALIRRATRLAMPTERRSLLTRSARSTALPGARRESTTIAPTQAARSTRPTGTSAASAAPAAMTAIGTTNNPAPRQVIAARSPGDRDSAHSALHGGDLGHALDLRFWTANHPVPECRDADVLDVVRHHVVT